MSSMVRPAWQPRNGPMADAGTGRALTLRAPSDETSSPMASRLPQVLIIV